MNINEACKLARNIKECVEVLQRMSYKSEYAYKIEMKHEKKAVNPDVEDLTEDNTADKEYDVSMNQIVKAMLYLNKEAAKVSKAIEVAKNSALVNVNGEMISVDSATEYNRNLRSTINIMRSLSKNKDTESKSRGSDYKFDIEGKQTPFYYNITTTKTVDYDKTEIKNEEKAIRKEVEEISIAIDKAKLDTEVMLDTVFDVNTDSFEDVLEKILEELK